MYKYHITISLENPNHIIDSFEKEFNTAIKQYNSISRQATNPKKVAYKKIDTRTYKVALESVTELKVPTKALRLLSADFLKECVKTGVDISYYGKVFNMKIEKENQAESINVKNLADKLNLRLLSLNTNLFSGLQVRDNKNNTLKSWEKKVDVDFAKNIELLIKYIKKENADIVCLYEYFLNSSHADVFLAQMKNLGYNKMYCNNTKKDGRYSVAVVFVKEKYSEKVEVLNSPNYLDGRVLLMNFDNRCLIYAIHAPLKEKDSNEPCERVERFWRETKEFCITNKNEKLLMIGDFNLFINGTIQKKAYLELLKDDFTDLWLSQGGAHERITHVKGARLDYALASESMLEQSKCVKIDDTPRVIGFTDHSAVICELDL